VLLKVQLRSLGKARRHFKERSDRAQLAEEEAGRAAEEGERARFEQLAEEQLHAARRAELGHSEQCALELARCDVEAILVPREDLGALLPLRCVDLGGAASTAIAVDLLSLLSGLGRRALERVPAPRFKAPGCPSPPRPPR
jgi:hypothetical protein